ncbi:hypothetical protein EBU71_22865 [bacterium]|nr:hypothetical protein [Candidatus Elulimicrobium humile]
MSLATFKKKSINSASSATKRSGKLTNEYWIYQGPYGRKGNLPSTIFNASLVGPNGMVGGNYYDASNAGFSINGSNRNIGGVGASMRFSKSATPYRGQYPKGWGGTRGRYPDGPNEIMLNITPVLTGVAIQNAIVKPSVLSTKGMLQRRYRWINSGQYPNYWVQPVYTGNQTDTASQGLYIHNKAAANYCWYDVNTPELYVDYRKTCGSTGCQTTPARGYTMNIQTANAAYTKTLHQPKDASDYTLRIQRRCQNPVGFQKPFPYAVQTGTGVLRGGITVDNVASSCNISKPVLTPPDWYTGASVLKADGSKTTLKDQLEALRKTVSPEVQNQVFNQVFLEGTTN